MVSPVLKALPGKNGRTYAGVDPTRDDWLEAARIALLRGGVEAVSVSALAREKGLSRGAFYWHFDTRDALLQALLRVVARRATVTILESLPFMSFEDGMLALLDQIFAPNEASQDAAIHLKALQRWADTEEEIRDQLVECEEQRDQAIQRFLLASDYPNSEARVRAMIIACALKYEQVQKPGVFRLSYPTDLPTIFRLLTGREIPLRLVSRHLNHALPKRQLETIKASPPRTCEPPAEPQQL